MTRVLIQLNNTKAVPLVSSPPRPLTFCASSPWAVCSPGLSKQALSLSPPGWFWHRMPLHTRLVCIPPSLSASGSGRWPADLALRELEHLHGLLHQALVIALPQQPVTGTKIAEKLGQKGAKREGIR